MSTKLAKIRIIELIKEINKSVYNDKKIPNTCKSILMRLFLCEQPQIIANKYNIDNALKLININSNLQIINKNQYTKCVCGRKLTYQVEKFGLYCGICGILKYEGNFVIDKAINPMQQQNHYTQMDTFFNWIDSLLYFKNIIPPNIENKIMINNCSLWFFDKEDLFMFFSLL